MKAIFLSIFFSLGLYGCVGADWKDTLQEQSQRIKKLEGEVKELTQEQETLQYRIQKHRTEFGELRKKADQAVLPPFMESNLQEGNN